jgi:DNA primase
VRGVQEATVSTPITWGEVDDVEPREFTIQTVPERFARLGDLHAGIDDAVFSLEPLLEWAERDDREGAGDPGGSSDA